MTTKRAGSPYYYTEFEIEGRRFSRSTRRAAERGSEHHNAPRRTRDAMGFAFFGDIHHDGLPG